MKRIDLSVPEFGFIVGTRALLGAGIGILLAGKIGQRNRVCVGAMFVGLGLLATIPAAKIVFGRGLKNGEHSPKPA